MSKRVKSPSGNALFPVLPRGTHGIPAEQVAADQRTRLQGAMLAAVARNGYQKVTVKQLVALAGVSRSTFYRHFTDKEDCFLTTYDSISAAIGKRVAHAYLAHDDWRQGLTAGFAAFVDFLLEEGDGAHFVLVDAIQAGPRLLEHRERLADSFESLVREGFERAPKPGTVTDMTIKAIVAGARRVAYRRVLHGEPEQLRELGADLLAWALSYHQPGVKPPQRPPDAKRDTHLPLHEALKETRIPPLDPTTARRTLSQRERILHAIVTITSEGGYPALSIPAISKVAGTSNVAFYENFQNKQQAFLTAFEEVMQRAFASASEAFISTPDWPEAVHATIATLLRFVAEERVFARLALFDILTGGPPAIARAEQSLDAFQSMFAPGLEINPDIPPTIPEALIGGLWNIMQHEVGHGRGSQLPELTGELTYITLAPFLGAREAARIARGQA